MKIYVENFVKNSNYFFASQWIDGRRFYYIGNLNNVKVTCDDFRMLFEKIAVVSERTYMILHNVSADQLRLVTPSFRELVIY